MSASNSSHKLASSSAVLGFAGAHGHQEVKGAFL